jgi:hypothetical protein
MTSDVYDGLFGLGINTDKAITGVQAKKNYTEFGAAMGENTAWTGFQPNECHSFDPTTTNVVETTSLNQLCQNTDKKSSSNRCGMSNCWVNGSLFQL